MPTRKLRVGVLVDTRDLLAWECAMLERIANSCYAELAVVVRRNTVTERHHPDGRQGLGSRLSSAAQKVIRTVQAKLEDKVGGSVPDAIEISKDLDQFRGIPHLDLTSAQETSSALINSFDVKIIRAFDVDVFIALAIGPFQGDVPNVAKHGIWYLPRANHRIENRAANADGFWEVLHNVPVTESTLQLLSTDPNGAKVIGRTQLASCTVSVRRNRNLLYWKASYQIPRKLEQLWLLGPDMFFENVDRNNEYTSVKPTLPLPIPRLADEIALVSRIFWRIYANRIRSFFAFPQWILLFDFQGEFSLTPSGFRKIIPPRDRSWADPHVLIRNRICYVFIEELRYSRKRGHISVMQVEEDGTHTVPLPILEESHHLSHPFVFDHCGQLFMIPESAKNRSVDLYRCVSFPDKWEHYETLLKEVHAVDTIVHFCRGKWWLFTNMREHVSGSSNDDLFLFYSEDLQRGHWTAHPCNPIVSDVTRARPAGNIFEHEGNLYRPAQDCSVRYGFGIRIQEILKISESEYVEREAAFIHPRRGGRMLAMHSYSRAGRIVFSDALHERWRLFAALRRSA